MFLFFKKYRLFLKIPALFLSTYFMLFEPLAHAQTLQRAEGREQREETLLSIPPDLGHIEEVYQAPCTMPRALCPVVYYIQDAHDSLEAQENIAKIIQKLVAKRGVKTVFEEGYEGPVPTDEYFGWIKDPIFKKKLSYFLMDHLRLGGAEYAHINRFAQVDRRQTTDHSQNRGPWTMDRGHNFELIGADNIKEHLATVKAYAAYVPEQQAAEKDLKAIEEKLRELIRRSAPDDFKSWLKLHDRFEAGKLDLIEYLQRSILVVMPDFMSVRPASPELQRGEQARIRHPESGSRLGGRDDKKTNDAESFLKKFPLLHLLILSKTSKNAHFLNQIKSVTGETIFREMQNLEAETSKRLLREDRDQIAFKYLKQIHLIQKLNRLGLTAEEFNWVQSSLAQIKTESIADFIFSQNQKLLVLSKAWEQAIPGAVKFYELAIKREGSIKTQLERFAGERVSVLAGKPVNSHTRIPNHHSILVFGGFHKSGIKKILQERGDSYYVITPHISGASKRHQDYYQSLMSGHLHPYEKSLGLMSRAAVVPRVFEVMSTSEIRQLANRFSFSKQVPSSIVRSEIRYKKTGRWFPKVLWTLFAPAAFYTFSKLGASLQEAIQTITPLYGAFSDFSSLLKNLNDYVIELIPRWNQTMISILHQGGILEDYPAIIYPLILLTGMWTYATIQSFFTQAKLIKQLPSKHQRSELRQTPHTEGDDSRPVPEVPGSPAHSPSNLPPAEQVSIFKELTPEQLSIEFNDRKRMILEVKKAFEKTDWKLRLWLFWVQIFSPLMWGMLYNTKEHPVPLWIIPILTVISLLLIKINVDLFRQPFDNLHRAKKELVDEAVRLRKRFRLLTSKTEVPVKSAIALTPSRRFVHGVFKGGGTRVIAQIGMLEEAMKQGVQFKSVAGTSGGSFLAGLLAVGYTPEEIKNIILNTDFKQFEDPIWKIPLNLLRGGIHSVDQLETFNRKLITAKRGGEDVLLKDLQIPFSATITITKPGGKRELFILNARTAPYLPLSKAMTLSQTLTPFFKPVIVTSELSRKISNLPIGTVIEDGIWAGEKDSGFPLRVYENKQDAFPVMGFYTVNKDQVVDTGWSLFSEKVIYSVMVPLIKEMPWVGKKIAAFERALDGFDEEITQAFKAKHPETLFVGVPLQAGALQLGMHLYQKLLLYKAGQDAMRRFLRSENAQFRSEVRAEREEFQKRLSEIEELMRAQPWDFFKVGEKGDEVSAQVKTYLELCIKKLREADYVDVNGKVAAAKDLILILRSMNALKAGGLIEDGAMERMARDHTLRQSYKLESSFGQNKFLTLFIRRSKESRYEPRIEISVGIPVEGATTSFKWFDPPSFRLDWEAGKRKNPHTARLNPPKSFERLMDAKDRHWKVDSLKSAREFTSYARKLQEKYFGIRKKRSEMREEKRLRSKVSGLRDSATSNLQLSTSNRASRSEIRQQNAKLKKEITEKIAQRIASDFIRNQTADSSSEIKPFIVIDGLSGIGKSTLAKSLRVALSKLEHPSLYLSLDMFMLERKKRYEMMEDILRGRKDPESFNEREFWDIDKIKEVLSEINKFRKSNKQTLQLNIKKAYDPRLKKYRSRKFTIRKNTVLIFEGMYAYAKELQDLYGEDPFRVRIEKNSDVVRAQMQRREARFRGGNKMRKFLEYYDRILMPSYKRYAVATSRGSHVLTFMGNNEEMPRSEVRKEERLTENLEKRLTEDGLRSEVSGLRDSATSNLQLSTSNRAFRSELRNDSKENDGRVDEWVRAISDPSEQLVGNAIPSHSWPREVLNLKEVTAQSLTQAANKVRGQLQSGIPWGFIELTYHDGDELTSFLGNQSLRETLAALKDDETIQLVLLYHPADSKDPKYQELKPEFESKGIIVFPYSSDPFSGIDSSKLHESTSPDSQARSEVRKQNGKPILLVVGLPGSGKSTIGALIAGAMGLPFISMGDFNRAANVSKGSFPGGFKPRMERLVEHLKENGLLFQSGFVLDLHPMNKEKFLSEQKKLADAGFEIVQGIFVSVSPQLAKSRILARPPRTGEASLNEQDAERKIRELRRGLSWILNPGPNAQKLPMIRVPNDKDIHSSRVSENLLRRVLAELGRKSFPLAQADLASDRQKSALTHHRSEMREEKRLRSEVSGLKPPATSNLQLSTSNRAFRSEVRSEDKTYVAILRELNSSAGPRPSQNTNDLNITEILRWPKLYERLLAFKSSFTNSEMKVLILGPGMIPRGPQSSSVNWPSGKAFSPQTIEILAALHSDTIHRDFTVIDADPVIVKAATNPEKYFWMDVGTLPKHAQDVAIIKKMNEALLPFFSGEPTKHFLEIFGEHTPKDFYTHEHSLHTERLLNKATLNGFVGDFAYLNYGQNLLDVIVASQSLRYPFQFKSLLDSQGFEWSNVLSFSELIKALRVGGILLTDPDTMDFVMKTKVPNIFDRGDADRLQVLLLQHAVSATIDIHGNIIEIRKQPLRSEVRKGRELSAKDSAFLAGADLSQLPYVKELLLKWGGEEYKEDDPASAKRALSDAKDLIRHFLRTQINMLPETIEAWIQSSVPNQPVSYKQVGAWIDRIASYKKWDRWIGSFSSYLAYQSHDHAFLNQYAEAESKIQNYFESDLKTSSLALWSTGVILSLHLRHYGPHSADVLFGEEYFLDNELLVGVVRKLIPNLLKMSESEFQEILPATPDYSGPAVQIQFGHAMEWGIAVMLEPMLHHYQNGISSAYGQRRWINPENAILDYLKRMLSPFESVSDSELEQLLTRILTRTDENWVNLGFRPPRLTDADDTVDYVEWLVNKAGAFKLANRIFDLALPKPESQVEIPGSYNVGFRTVSFNSDDSTIGRIIKSNRNAHTFQWLFSRPVFSERFPTLAQRFSKRSEVRRMTLPARDVHRVIKILNRIGKQDEQLRRGKTDYIESVYVSVFGDPHAHYWERNLSADKKSGLKINRTLGSPQVPESLLEALDRYEYIHELYFSRDVAFNSATRKDLGIVLYYLPAILKLYGRQLGIHQKTSETGIRVENLLIEARTAEQYLPKQILISNALKRKHLPKDVQVYTAKEVMDFSRDEEPGSFDARSEVRTMDTEFESILNSNMWHPRLKHRENPDVRVTYKGSTYTWKINRQNLNEKRVRIISALRDLFAPLISRRNVDMKKGFSFEEIEAFLGARNKEAVARWIAVGHIVGAWKIERERKNNWEESFRLTNLPKIMLTRVDRGQLTPPNESERSELRQGEWTVPIFLPLLPKDYKSLLDRDTRLFGTSSAFSRLTELQELLQHTNSVFTFYDGMDLDQVVPLEEFELIRASAVGDPIKKRATRMMLVKDLIFVGIPEVVDFYKIGKQTPPTVINGKNIEQVLDGSLATLKSKLQLSSEELKAQVVFYIPSHFISAGPQSDATATYRFSLHTSTVHSLLQMQKHKDHFKGATVIDAASGDGVLARAVLALGAKKVILIEKEYGLCEVARKLLKAQGWKEAPSLTGEGDFFILNQDLMDVDWEALAKLEPSVATLNFGSTYNKSGLNSNDVVIQRLKDMNSIRLVINAGHHGLYENKLPENIDGRKMFGDLGKRFKVAGFEVDGEIIARLAIDKPDEKIYEGDGIFVATRKGTSQTEASMPAAEKVSKVASPFDPSFWNNINAILTESRVSKYRTQLEAFFATAASNLDRSAFGTQFSDRLYQITVSEDKLDQIYATWKRAVQRNTRSELRNLEGFTFAKAQPSDFYSLHERAQSLMTIHLPTKEDFFSKKYPYLMFSHASSILHKEAETNPDVWVVKNEKGEAEGFLIGKFIAADRLKELTGIDQPLEGGVFHLDVMVTNQNIKKPLAVGLFKHFIEDLKKTGARHLIFTMDSENEKALRFSYGMAKRLKVPFRVLFESASVVWTGSAGTHRTYHLDLDPEKEPVENLPGALPSNISPDQLSDYVSKQVQQGVIATRSLQRSEVRSAADEVPEFTKNRVQFLNALAKKITLQNSTTEPSQIVSDYLAQAEARLVNSAGNPLLNQVHINVLPRMAETIRAADEYQLKKNKTIMRLSVIPHLAVNGSKYTYLTNEFWVLRLSRAGQKDFIAGHAIVTTYTPAFYEKDNGIYNVGLMIYPDLRGSELKEKWGISSSEILDFVLATVIQRKNPKLLSTNAHYAISESNEIWKTGLTTAATWLRAGFYPGYQMNWAKRVQGKLARGAKIDGKDMSDWLMAVLQKHTDPQVVYWVLPLISDGTQVQKLVAQLPTDLASPRSEVREEDRLKSKVSGLKPPATANLQLSTLNQVEGADNDGRGEKLVAGGETKLSAVLFFSEYLEEFYKLCQRVQKQIKQSKFPFHLSLSGWGSGYNIIENITRIIIVVRRPIFQARGNSPNNLVARPAAPINWANFIAESAMNLLLSMPISGTFIVLSLHPLFSWLPGGGNHTHEVILNQYLFSLLAYTIITSYIHTKEVRQGGLSTEKRSTEDRFRFKVLGLRDSAASNLQLSTSNRASRSEMRADTSKWGKTELFDELQKLHDQLVPYKETGLFTDKAREIAAKENIPETWEIVTLLLEEAKFGRFGTQIADSTLNSLQDAFGAVQEDSSVRIQDWNGANRTVEAILRDFLTITKGLQARLDSKFTRSEVRNNSKDKDEAIRINMANLLQNNYQPQEADFVSQRDVAVKAIQQSQVIRNDRGLFILQTKDGKRLVEELSWGTKRFFNLKGRWILTLDPSNHPVDKFIWDSEGNFLQVWTKAGNGLELGLRADKQTGLAKSLWLFEDKKGKVEISFYSPGIDFNHPEKIPYAQENVIATLGGQLSSKQISGSAISILRILSWMAKDKGVDMVYQGNPKAGELIATDRLFSSLLEVGRVRPTKDSSLASTIQHDTPGYDVAIKTLEQTSGIPRHELSFDRRAFRLNPSSLRWIPEPPELVFAQGDATVTSMQVRYHQIERVFFDGNFYLKDEFAVGKKRVGQSVLRTLRKSGSSGYELLENGKPVRWMDRSGNVSRILRSEVRSQNKFKSLAEGPYEKMVREIYREAPNEVAKTLSRLTLPDNFRVISIGPGEPVDETDIGFTDWEKTAIDRDAGSVKVYEPDESVKSEWEARAGGNPKIEFHSEKFDHTNASPADLILLNGVLSAPNIVYGKEIKESLLNGLSHALQNGGYLVVGMMNVMANGKSLKGEMALRSIGVSQGIQYEEHFTSLAIDRLQTILKEKNLKLEEVENAAGKDRRNVWQVYRAMPIRSELRKEDENRNTRLEALLKGSLVSDDLKEPIRKFFTLTEGNDFKSSEPLQITSADGTIFRFVLSGNTFFKRRSIAVSSGSDFKRIGYGDYKLGDSINKYALAEFAHHTETNEPAISVDPAFRKRNLGAVLLTLSLYDSYLNGDESFEVLKVQHPEFHRKLGFEHVAPSPFDESEHYRFDFKTKKLPALPEIKVPEAASEMLTLRSELRKADRLTSKVLDSASTSNLKLETLDLKPEALNSSLRSELRAGPNQGNQLTYEYWAGEILDQAEKCRSSVTETNLFNFFENALNENIQSLLTFYENQGEDGRALIIGFLNRLHLDWMKRGLTRILGPFPNRIILANKIFLPPDDYVQKQKTAFKVVQQMAAKENTLWAWWTYLAVSVLHLRHFGVHVERLRDGKLSAIDNEIIAELVRDYFLPDYLKWREKHKDEILAKHPKVIQKNEKMLWALALALDVRIHDSETLNYSWDSEIGKEDQLQDPRILFPGGGSDSVSHFLTQMFKGYREEQIFPVLREIIALYKRKLASSEKLLVWDSADRRPSELQNTLWRLHSHSLLVGMLPLLSRTDWQILRYQYDPEFVSGQADSIDQFKIDPFQVLEEALDQSTTLQQLIEKLALSTGRQARVTYDEVMNRVKLAFDQFMKVEANSLGNLRSEESSQVLSPEGRESAGRLARDLKVLTTSFQNPPFTIQSEGILFEAIQPGDVVYQNPSLFVFKTTPSAARILIKIGSSQERYFLNQNMEIEKMTELSLAHAQPFYRVIPPSPRSEMRGEDGLRFQASGSVATSNLKLETFNHRTGAVLYLDGADLMNRSELRQEAFVMAEQNYATLVIYHAEKMSEKVYQLFSNLRSVRLVVGGIEKARSKYGRQKSAHEMVITTQETGAYASAQKTFWVEKGVDLWAALRQAVSDQLLQGVGQVHGVYRVVDEALREQLSQIRAQLVVRIAA